MVNEKRFIDQGKVYEMACAGCTRHGEALGECNSDEPCERLIFAFTVAEPVDAVEVVRCGECKHFCEPFCCRRDDEAHRERINMLTVDFCSYGERRTDV